MWLFSISYILSNTSLVRCNYWVLPCNITFISWLQSCSSNRPPPPTPTTIFSFLFCYSWVGSVLIQYWFRHWHTCIVVHGYAVIEQKRKKKSAGLSLLRFIVLVGSRQRGRSETLPPLKINYCPKIENKKQTPAIYDIKNNNNKKCILTHESFHKD